MYCPSCGARNLTGATACVDCGRPFPVMAPAPAPAQPPSILRRPGPLAPPSLDGLPRAPSSQDAPVTAPGGPPPRAPVVDVPTTEPRTPVRATLDDRTVPERPAVLEPPRTEPARQAPGPVASAAPATAAVAPRPAPPVVAAPPAMPSAPQQAVAPVVAPTMPPVAPPPAVVAPKPAVAPAVAAPPPPAPVIVAVAAPPPSPAPIAAPPAPPPPAPVVAAVAAAPPPSPVVAAPPPSPAPVAAPPPPAPVVAPPKSAPVAAPPAPLAATAAPKKPATSTPARTPKPVTVKLAVPGTLRQLGAALVDGVGVGVAVFAALRALLAALDVRPTVQGVVDALHENPVTVAPLLLAVPLGFFAWHLVAVALQGTPGQRLVGLRLVDKVGQKPALPGLVVRAVAQAVGGLLFFAGPAWALLVDGRRRGFGDVVAGTVAVVVPKDPHGGR
jgi:uncharacterized RDD family membrane protein YckC